MCIFEKRRANLRALMKTNAIEALIVTPSTDFYYLTGYNPSLAQRITCLCITPQRQFIFAPDFELERYHPTDDLTLTGWTDNQDPLQELAFLLPTEGTLALCKAMPAAWVLGLQAQLPHCRCQNADVILAPMRSIKNAQELDIIRTAQQMAESALEMLLQQKLCGQTEIEIAQTLRALRLQAGFEAAGCGIIASGPNSANPHHINTRRMVQTGDALMFDIGGLYKGYHADMTRTFFVGEPTALFCEVYETVLQAHSAVLAAIKAGATACSIDACARNVIAQAGYGGYFPHRLGHGIGLDVHEAPFITKNNNAPLQAGQVFSNEPGIYLPQQFGVRIEDLVTVTKDGAQVLNHMQKNLRCIL